MWRRFLRVETGLFIALWLVLMLVGRSSLFLDPGTFWHTVTGEKILDAGEVVRSDPFSFTFAGQPWVAHQWLAECGMATVYRAGGEDNGWDMLMLATVTLLAGIYTWLGARLIRAGFHPLPAGLVLAVVLLASSPQFHVRPLIFSIGLLGLTYALLVDVEAGRKRLGYLWWLLPVIVLWANLHGGVLAGIGSLALGCAGWSLAWAKGWPSPVRGGRDLLSLAALVVACCLAVLINPYGIGLPRAWLNTLVIPLPGLIREHARLDVTDPLGWTAILLGAGYLIALMGVSPKQTRMTWLLPLVWFLLAYQRVRNVPLFAITAAVAIAEILPQTRWAPWLRRREMLLEVQRPGARAGRWKPLIIPLVLVGAAIWLKLSGVPAPLFGSDWVRFDSARWPVELVEDLEKIDHRSRGNTRIFNDLDFGGFVIFHARRLKVFVDDRCALYGAEFLQEYDYARRKHPAQIDRWQQEFGFGYALVEAGGGFDRFLEQSKQWILLRRAHAAALYRYYPGLQFIAVSFP